MKFPSFAGAMKVTAAFLRGAFSWGIGNRDKGRQSSGNESRLNESGVALTDKRAFEIPTVFSCVRLLSEVVGSMPVGVYERTAEGRKPANNHPVALLLEEPNEFMTRQQLVEAVTAQLSGWGNSYSLIDRADDGRAVALWPLLPSDMQVHRNGFESLTYKYNTSAGQRELAQRQVLHVRGFGTDGVVGLSPLGYAAQALGLSIAAEKYAAGFYSSGGRPSGVLQVEKPLTPDQRKALKENYAPIVGGSGGENGLWILEAFAKYQAISISPEDAQMLVTRQFSVEEIARFFRVPLSLLMHGSKDSNWGTGLEQQDLAFLKYTLRPYLTRIESTMNRALFSPADRKRFYVEFAVEGLLRGDSKARGEFYSSALQNGWMNRNEVRAFENMPPYGGGEKFTAQTALTTVDKLGVEAPKPALAEPAKAAQSITVQSADTEQLALMTKAAADLGKHENTLARAVESLTEQTAKMQRRDNDTQAAILKLASEVARPRAAVFDKDGNVIGNKPVDKLE